MTMNSSSIAMQVLGLMVESITGGPPSTMRFYERTLMLCSRTMGLGGGRDLHEVLNGRTTASYQFYGFPLDVKLLAPQFLMVHGMT